MQTSGANIVAKAVANSNSSHQKKSFLQTVLMQIGRAGMLALLPAMAFAHPGHGMQSVHAGFLHPFSGWDHLLVMLAVGLWAAKLGGKSRWQLPLLFMLFMAAGAVLGMSGISLPGIETAIAASVMAMGLLLVLSVPLHAAWRMGLVSLFALAHGLAHGAELSTQSGGMALAGMLAATAVLHGIGLALGSQRFNLANKLQAGLAWVMMLAGGYMLIA